MLITTLLFYVQIITLTLTLNYTIIPANPWNYIRNAPSCTERCHYYLTNNPKIICSYPCNTKNSDNLNIYRLCHKNRISRVNGLIMNNSDKINSVPLLENSSGSISNPGEQGDGSGPKFSNKGLNRMFTILTRWMASSLVPIFCTVTRRSNRLR